jgi:hypothetical protein
MIARLWCGRTPADKLEAYLDLMRTVALPDYRAIQGNLAAYVLSRNEGAVGHVWTLTLWEDERAIASFAGEPIDQAKYYDFDSKFLLDMVPKVTHFQVVDG